MATSERGMLDSKILQIEELHRALPGLYEVVMGYHEVVLRLSN